jgi:hypothetical protein
MVIVSFATSSFGVPVISKEQRKKEKKRKEKKKKRKRKRKRKRMENKKRCWSHDK